MACSLTLRRFLYQSKGIRAKRRFHVSISNLNDEKTTIEWLNSLGGGSVDLKMDDSSGIAILKINNPERRNSMTGKMMVDLHNAVNTLSEWKKGKGIIMYGTKGTFCSGGDLGSLKSIFDPESGYKMCDFMQNCTTNLSNLPLLSVALLQGMTLGGGAELSTACDFRLMTERSRIGFVQTRLGISPGWGGGTRLVHLVGKTNALKLLSSAEILRADDALQIGLICGIIDDDEALKQTQKWLGTYLKVEIQGINTVKKVVTAASENSLEKSLEIEKNLFKSVWGSEVHTKKLGQGLKHKK